MTIRCAWCRQIMGCTLEGGVEAHKVSDGICLDCFEEQVREHEALHRMRPAADVVTEVATCEARRVEPAIATDVEVGLEAARRVG